MELESIAFDPREVVGDSVQLLNLTAAEKGIDLIFRVSPEVPPIMLGDPGRLRQVLVNLLGNAVKFTDRGEVFADVSLESQTENTVRLHCSVSDTGIGIPADKQEGIFEAFHQVDSSTTRRFGGTGLGLAVSSRLVGLMGGRIWVESEVGLGSTFHFTAHFGAAGDLPAVPALLREFEAAPVMIVDSHLRRRLIHEELLIQQGLRPVVAANELMALAEIDCATLLGSPFRLAILDCGEPGPKGWPLVDRIYEAAAPTGCAIVVLIPATRERVPVDYRQLPGHAFPDETSQVFRPDRRG